jgi:hypothetical protein
LIHACNGGVVADPDDLVWEDPRGCIFPEPSTHEHKHNIIDDVLKLGTSSNLHTANCLEG